MQKKQIDLTFYFFKERDRNFDLSELLAFFDALEYFKFHRKEDDVVIEYKNPILNFGANFIVSKRSVLTDLHLLDGKYLDLNLRLELHEPLISTAKLTVLVDIVGKMCRRFNFAVYNQLFEDVSPFKSQMLIKAYDLFKAAYKNKYEEHFAPFSKMDSLALENISSFLLEKNNLDMYYQNQNLKTLDYQFYKERGTRQAYAAAVWNGTSQFMLPPNANFIALQSGSNQILIPYKDFVKKLGRLLKPLESDTKILSVDDKGLKKVKKIVGKTSFKPIHIPLEEITFDKIIDL